MVDSNDSLFTTTGTVNNVPADLDNLSKLVYIYGNQFAVKGRSYRFFVDCRDWQWVDRVPETVPVIEVTYFDKNGNRVIIKRDDASNIVDDTQTVNGSTYYLDATLPSNDSIQSVEAKVLDYSKSTTAIQEVINDLIPDLTLIPDLAPATDTMHLGFSDIGNDEAHYLNDMDDATTSPDTDPLGASVGGISTWYTNRASGEDWYIYGGGQLPSDIQSFDIVVDGVTYDMTSHANATINPSTGQWSFKVPTGVPANEGTYPVTTSVLSSPGGFLFIGTASGNYVVDRTAPVFTFDWGTKVTGGQIFGDSAGSPAYPGEYVRWIYTASDDNFRQVIVSEQSGDFMAGQTGTYTTTTGNSGFARIYDVSGSTKTLRATAYDWAGNTTTVDITLHLAAKPAAPVIVTTATSSNESPKTLNVSQFGQTDYDDNTVTATISITPALEQCRNSANDDTRARLISNSLTISTYTRNDIDGVASVSATSAVSSQVSELGTQVRGEVLDQYYRTTFDLGGNWDYNAEKLNDMGTTTAGGLPALGSDQTLVSPPPGFTAINSEVFHDAVLAPRTSADSRYNGGGPVSFDGSIENGFWKPTSISDTLIVKVPLPGVGLTKNQYTLIGRRETGALGNGDGFTVESSEDGVTWTVRSFGVPFTGSNGVSNMYIRLVTTAATEDVESLGCAYQQ